MTTGNLKRPGFWRVLWPAAFAAAALAAAHGHASAAGKAFRRGVSMELWTTWPAEADWADEGKLFPFPEWRRTVTAADLGALKASGLDFVRMPVDPGVFFSENAKPHRKRLLAEIETAVGDLRAAGLNVILDLHTIPGGDDRPASIESVLADDAAFDRYVAFAAEFTARFAKTKGVAVELINEPVIDCDDAGARWPAMAGRLYKAARARAPGLPLVLTGGCWGAAEHLDALPTAIKADQNVFLSFHSYAPFVLTHQGATWAGDFIVHVNGLPFPPDRYGKGDLKTAVRGVRQKIRDNAPADRVTSLLAYLDEQIAEIDTPAKLEAAMAKPFDIAARFADDNGIDRGRILLGEFGMIRQEWGNPNIIPAEWRADYLSAMRKMAEGHGFGWSIWGYSGAFGIVQEFGGTRLEDDLIGKVLAE